MPDYNLREQKWLTMSREQQYAAYGKAVHEEAIHHDKFHKGRTREEANVLYDMKTTYVYGNHSG